MSSVAGTQVSSSESVNIPQVKPVPLEQNERLIKELLGVFNKRVFNFYYRNKYKPQEQFILAMNLEDARENCQEYCNRFGLRFISVTPFFLDLNKKSKEQIEDDADAALNSV